MEKTNILTTAAGNPVPNNQHSLTAGPRGPVLMQDYHLFEKMARFNRERLPERVVHTKGYSAYGTFTVTNDITPTRKPGFLLRLGSRRSASAASPPWAGRVVRQIPYGIHVGLPSSSTPRRGTGT